MSSSVRRPSLLAMLLVLLAPVGVAHASGWWPGPWQPWAEVGAIGSTELHYGELAFFLPVGNETTLGFLEVRSKYFTEFDAGDDPLEGNLALGMRHMLEKPVLGQGWNLGFWAGADYRHSESNNEFWQASLGLEALSADWDVRANGYIPITDAKDADRRLVRVDVSGSQIQMTGGQEVPLYGFDAEIGWRVPLERMWQGADRHEWRIYAGGFHFDDDDAEEDISGPRVRSEWRLFDVIPALPGSRLTLAFEFQYDDVRKDQWSGGLRLRIPLSGPAEREVSPQVAARQRRLRRMTERIERDVDLVAGASRAESVLDPRTGLGLGSVTVVNGGTADPEGTIEGAGAGSVVIADGSQGAISTSTTIDLNPSQVLVGGGAAFEVRGARTGATATFTVPGARPTIQNSNNGVDTIVLADQTTLRGLDVEGGFDGISDGGTTITSFGVFDNRVSGVAGDGFFLSAVDAGAQVAGNSASGNGFDGFSFNGSVSGEVTGNTASGNGVDGFSFSGSVGGLLAGNTASGNTFDGFSFADSVSGQLTGNSASGNTFDGFSFADSVSGQLTGNSASGNEFDGFSFAAAVSGQLTGNTASGNTFDGFSFADSVSGQLTGNSASGNEFDGFSFAAAVSGQLTGNTASGNGLDGFSFAASMSGQLTGNTALSNTFDGFSFADSVSGQLTGNTASGNGLDGFSFAASMSGQLTGNTASSNTFDGFSFADSVSGQLTGNTASGNGLDGLSFAASMSGQLTGNTASGNADDGFDLSVNAGTFSNNTANDNGDLGYEVDTNTGTADGNTGTGNTNGGNVFP